MNWMETVLVTCGISLDIFALVAKKGAQMSRISKQTLALFSGVFALFQTLILGAGILVGRFLYAGDVTRQDTTTEMIAAFIFGVLGIAKMIQSRKHEMITEHLDNRISWKKMLKQSSVVALSTCAVGIALGFLGTQTILVLIMVAVTVIVVILGFYMGYHYGYQMNATVSLISGGLFLIAAADTIARHIL